MGESCGRDRAGMRLVGGDGDRDGWIAGAGESPGRRSSSLGGEPTGWRAPLDRAAAERGRAALLLEGFLKPEWSEAAYRNAGRLWEGPAPDPEKDPAGLCGRVPAPLWSAPGPLPQRRAADGPAPRARARRA